jgi:hypothetical protein
VISILYSSGLLSTSRSSGYPPAFFTPYLNNCKRRDKKNKRKVTRGHTKRWRDKNHDTYICGKDVSYNNLDECLEHCLFFCVSKNELESWEIIHTNIVFGAELGDDIIGLQHHRSYRFFTHINPSVKRKGEKKKKEDDFILLALFGCV